MARMKSHFQEAFGGEIAAAVFATGLDCPVSLNGRMKAMHELSTSANFEDMRATFKRVMGLTKEHTSTNIAGVSWVDPTEEVLANKFSEIHADVQQFIKEQQFSEALSCLSSIKEPIDALFDAVMVMDEDITIRKNRLSLLRTIADAFRQFADFTILST